MFTICEDVAGADIDGRVWAAMASPISVPRCLFLMTRSWAAEVGAGCILETFCGCL
jgi:hypothetical protein